MKKLIHLIAATLGMSFGTKGEAMRALRDNKAIPEEQKREIFQQAMRWRPCSPFNGKNRAQRQRLAAGFQSM